VIKDSAHDLLWHVVVDQACSEGMAPLVGLNADGLTALIANIAGLQPPFELRPVGGVGVVALPVAIGLLGREQVRTRAVWPLVEHPLLLGVDVGFDLLVDRYEGLAFHLVVVVAQIGGAVGVADDAIAGQCERVADAQPAPDQDDRDQTRGRVVPPGEVVGMFDLGHDVFGQGPGQLLWPLGVVLRVEHHPRREVCPAVQPDGLEEGAGQVDDRAAAARVVDTGLQLGQVVFQDVAGELFERADSDVGLGQEGPEPGDAGGAADDLAQGSCRCSAASAPTAWRGRSARAGESGRNEHGPSGCGCRGCAAARHREGIRRPSRGRSEDPRSIAARRAPRFEAAPRMAW
jgi:hypothetical protein